MVVDRPDRNELHINHTSFQDEISHQVNLLFFSRFMNPHFVVGGLAFFKLCPSGREPEGLIKKRRGCFLLFGGFRFGVLLTAPLEGFKRVFERFDHYVRRYLLARPPVGQFVGDEHMG
jgi:hypothetical protein